MADTFTLTDTQFVVLSVTFLDKMGNPAPVQGVPEWVSSDDNVIHLQDMAIDGMSVSAKAMGPLGNAQVTMTADADLGEGVTNVIGIITLTVAPSQAVTAVITPGGAQENP